MHHIIYTGHQLMQRRAKQRRAVALRRAALRRATMRRPAKLWRHRRTSAHCRDARKMWLQGKESTKGLDTLAAAAGTMTKHELPSSAAPSGL